ncbi:MAG: thiamine phosphate synthase [Tissierellia bacterium]|nr:thiamine phosphate synthase [Tissierellia bacterium]
MGSRKNFDIKAYLVVGPENTLGRDPVEIIRAAIEGGFTFVQIRSKEASARELIHLTCRTAQLLEEMGVAEEVSLVVDDRLDVVLAAREAGARVDGIHIGQTDIPASVCRKYLGPDAIVGISAATQDLFHYVQYEDVADLDYFGAGPLRYTETKPDCGLDEEGNFRSRSLEELTELARLSSLPVVVGGGVKLADIEDLRATGVDGFFVVSPVAGAEDPHGAARDLVDAWERR